MYQSGSTSDITHIQCEQQAMLAAAAHFNQMMKKASTNRHSTSPPTLNYMTNPFITVNKVCFLFVKIIFYYKSNEYFFTINNKEGEPTAYCAQEQQITMHSPPPPLPARPSTPHRFTVTPHAPRTTTMPGSEPRASLSPNDNVHINLEQDHFDARISITCDDDDEQSDAKAYGDDQLEEPQRESIEHMHLAFVKKEEQRALMRRLYHEGKHLPKSDDIAWSLKRSLKEHIFPKVKLLSDREHNYLAPNFVDDDCADQSRVIAEILLADMNLPQTVEYKVRFWVTYRSMIKQQLVKYRSNCVEEMKNVYLKGKNN
jgi:hypothetical protein